MKKKIISFFLTVSMIMGLVACGGSANEFIVEIEGDKYDLSGDFQEVVGSMVANGMDVADMYFLKLYDEAGKYSNTDMMEVMRLGEPYICVSERPIRQIECEIVVDRYNVGLRGGKFETVHGITHRSDGNDIEELNGFVSVPGMVNPNSEAYAAVFADGKMVNLEEYEDEVEEYLEILKEGNRETYVEKYWNASYYYPVSSRIMNNDVFGRATEEDEIESLIGPAWEGDLLVALAAADLAEQLQDGDIDEYSIMTYDYDNEQMVFYYDTYFMDEEWSSDKFR